MSFPDFSRVDLDLTATGAGPSRDPWLTPEGLTVETAYGPEALDRQLDDVMTKSPVTCDPSTAVMGALSQMTQRRIRHLPVVEGGKLVGFVSIGDLVKYRIDRIEAEAAAMRDYIAS